MKEILNSIGQFTSRYVTFLLRHRLQALYSYVHSTLYYASTLEFLHLCTKHSIKNLYICNVQPVVSFAPEACLVKIRSLHYNVTFEKVAFSRLAVGVYVCMKTLTTYNFYNCSIQNHSNTFRKEIQSICYSF